MSIIVTDNKLCKSIYDPKSKIIRSTYTGLANNKTNQILFQEHLDNGIALAKAHEIRGVLIDIRKLRGSYVRYFDFLEKVGYPTLKKSGFSHEAMVVSDDLIIANVTNRLLEILTRLQVKARVFNDLEEAGKWLRQQVE